MRIAIPHENGCLHGHFGGCREFVLVQVDPNQKRILHTKIVPAPEHLPGLFPRWLREQGATVVIVGGIGQRALDIFAHHGIAVCAGRPEARVEALVADYLDGQLTATPDGCEHHGHHHDHGHGPDYDHGHPYSHHDHEDSKEGAS